MLVPLEGERGEVVGVGAGLVEGRRQLVHRRVEHFVGYVVLRELCAARLAEARPVIERGAGIYDHFGDGVYSGSGHSAVLRALPHLIIDGDVRHFAALYLVEVAGGLYAVELAVELGDVGEHVVVLLDPGHGVVALQVGDVRRGDVNVLLVDVDECLAAPVGVRPLAVVVVCVALHVAAGEVPPYHLRAAALVKRVEVNAVAAHKLVNAGVGVAGGEPDDLHVVVGGALLLGLGVHVGHRPPEHVGGGLSLPVVGGAVLHVALQARDGGREVVYRGLAVLELDVAVATLD